MKKKLLSLILAVALIVTALSVPVLAAQKTYLPITIVDNYNDRTKISSFQVTKVENLPGRYMNRIHYAMTASNLSTYNAYMDIRCYDASGNLISTINFTNKYVSNSPIDVPDTTATIELIGQQGRNGDSYLYRKYVTVYAPDGRSMSVTDLQVPVYELVGWSKQRPATAGAATVTIGEQKTYFPVTIVDSYGDKTQINSFQVTGVQNLPGRYINRIYYTLSASKITSSNAYMDIKCYNAAGNLISTINFTNKYVSNSPIDVPDTTATIELVGQGGKSGDSYLYRKTIMVIANDGSNSMDITDLQLPVYRYVGWDLPVYMFSLDGRCIAVPSAQVEAHKQVGWYTYDGYYGALCWYCDEWLKAGAYETVFKSIDNGLAFLAGTEYEASLYAYRTRAMDEWRNIWNTPIATPYAPQKNGNVLAIQFRNVSYKDIRSFEAVFECYYSNGMKKGNFNAVANNNVYVPSAELREYSWNNSYFADVARVDVRITKAVFTDGTVWIAS